MVAGEISATLTSGLGWLYTANSSEQSTESTAVTWTASQFNKNLKLANQLGLANIQIEDSAANIVRIGSRLNSLQTINLVDSAIKIQSSWQPLVTLANQGKLDAVTFSDTTPVLTLKAAQFVTGSKLLALLGNTTSVTVTDTAANVGNMVLGAATPSQVTIKDTAANVGKQWTRLAVMAAQGELNAVTMTDRKPSLTLTATQYVNSSALRAQLQGASYIVKDTAANLAANADALAGADLQLVDTVQAANAQTTALASLAAAGQLKAVKLSGAGVMTLTAEQATQMGKLLGVNVEVKDTAAHIETNFTALSGLKKLTQVSLTDTARPTLTLSEAQYKSGSKLLAKISGAAVAVKFASNFENYRIQANTDGSYSVGNSKYKGVNFLQFANYTTFADTGNAAINAMLAGGTDFWWASGQTAKSSSTEIAPGLFALDASSTRHNFRYSFLQGLPDSAASDDHGFKPMNATQKQAVKDALSYLSSLINVSFEESTDGQADISFGTNDQTNSSGYANPPNGSGDHPVYLFLDNSGVNANNNFNDGSYGWQTLIHEIGHTLGLKHPGNYNATGGGSLGPFLPKATDTRRYTVMSYNNPIDAVKATATTSPVGETTYKLQYVYPQTYMSYDIAALQYLYGVGDGKNVNAYQVTNFSADWSGMQTLWLPANGTIDASTSNKSSIIDLRAGAFSSINLTPLSDIKAIPLSLRKQITYTGLNNVGLSYGSSISVAKGGYANDTFFDTVTPGDVLIDGGLGGEDVVYLSGKSSDWILTKESDAQVYTNQKINRAVKLIDIEFVRFYEASSASSTHSILDLYA